MKRTNVNQSTSSLIDPPDHKNSRQKLESVNPFSAVHNQHGNSSAQIIVSKIGLGHNRDYTRKSNHEHALEKAGPSAHYMEFDERELKYKMLIQF